MFPKPYMIIITHDGKRSQSNISFEAVSLAQLRSFLTLIELRQWIGARLKTKSYAWSVEIYENTDVVVNHRHLAQGYEQLINLLKQDISQLENI